MTRYALILLLTLSSTQLSGQGIRLTDQQAKAVLKDLADLDRLRVDSKADSATIAGLLVAHKLDSMAIVEAVRIAQDWHGLLSESDKRLTVAKKEVRKQKVLKWVGFGLAGLIAILAATR